MENNKKSVKLSTLKSYNECQVMGKISEYNLHSGELSSRVKSLEILKKIIIKNSKRAKAKISKEEFDEQFKEFYIELNKNSSMEYSALSPLQLEQLSEIKKEMYFFTTKVLTYLKSNVCTLYDIKDLLKSDVYKPVKLLGDLLEVTVNYDFVLKYNSSNVVEVIKLKNKAPDLSYKARKEENLPKNNIELFLMGEHFKLNDKTILKDNEEIKASFWYVRNKNYKLDAYKSCLNGDFTLLNDNLNELSNLRTELEYKGRIGEKVSKREINSVNNNLIKHLSVNSFNYNNGDDVISCNIKDFNKDYILRMIENLNEKMLSNDMPLDIIEQGKKCSNCYYKNTCDIFRSEISKLKGEEKNKTRLKSVDISVEDKKDKKNKNVKSQSKGKIKHTKEQLDVIEFNYGFARVMADSGVGKTATIISRVDKLLKDENVSPMDILLITFTNAGANEMLDRLTKLNKKGKYVNITTFNSYGSELISQHYKELGFINQPELATNHQLTNIVVDILLHTVLGDKGNKELYNKMKEFLDFKNPFMDLKYSKGVVFELLNFIRLSKTYNNKYPYDNYTEEQIEILNQFKDMYNKALKDSSLIDYQDQLLYCYKLLDDNFNKGEILDKYKHIIVDEFQDTNKIQIDILNKLIDMSNMDDSFKSLMCVGDDAQSIYSFNNTSPIYMIEFDRYLNIDKYKSKMPYKDFNLSLNFRSDEFICDLANNVLKHKILGLPKNMEANSKRKGETTLVEFDTKNNEYTYIAENISKIVTNGKEYDYKDIFVLARSRKELLDIKRVLDENNIPSKLKFQQRYIDYQPIKLYIGFMNYVGKIFENRELDNKKKLYTQELFDWILFTLYNKKYVDYDYNEFYDEYNEMANYNIYDENDKDNINIYVIKKALKIVEGINENLNKCDSDLELYQFALNLLSTVKEKDDRIDKILDSFSRKLYQEVGADVSEVRKITLKVSNMNIPKDEKVLMIYKEIYNMFKSILKVANDMVAYNDNSTYDEIEYGVNDDNDDNYVELTTAHSSKGLEKDVVYLVIDNFNYIDVPISGEDSDGYIVDNDKLIQLQEEYNLLYVSITRAKHKLDILYNTNMDKQRNKGKYNSFVNVISPYVSGFNIYE